MLSVSPATHGHPGGQGESPYERLRFFKAVTPRLARWAHWPLRDVVPSVQAVKCYVQALDHCQDVQGDPRAGAEALGRVRGRLGPLRDDALTALTPVIEAGLVQREGTLICPPVVVRAEAAADWLAWRSVELLLGLLGVKRDKAGRVKTGGLCVCKHCTLVFRPRGRKRVANTCPLCAHLPAALPLPLGLVRERLTGPGDRVRVRAPLMAEGSSRLIVGWNTTTIGRCVECGAPFSGRSDKRTCSDSCR